MDEFLPRQDLSKYNRYILNRIVARFTAEKEFNIYELVSESVSHKCILPSQNVLICFIAVLPPLNGTLILLAPPRGGPSLSPSLQ